MGGQVAHRDQDMFWGGPNRRLLPQTQQILGLMQIACNTHGTVNATILRITAQNIFIV